MKTLEILGYPEVDTDLALKVAISHLRGHPRNVPEYSGWEPAFILIATALIQMKENIE